MKIIACNIACNEVEEYDSEAVLLANIPGIEVAEHDWLFFTANGDALMPVFSTDAKINDDQKTYTNGVYTLRPASEEEFAAQVNAIYYYTPPPRIKNLDDALNWIQSQKSLNDQ